MNLVRDQRGVAFTETLIALPVVLLSFFGVYMFAYLGGASLVMQRAASAAARSASVFLADAAANYQGNADPTQARLHYAHEAARRVLSASSALRHGSLSTSVVGARGGFAPLRVQLRSHFDCSVFLLSALCGPDGVIELHAESVMPYQGP